MAKSKETQKEDLNEILMDISEGLRNIGDELAELNSSLSMLGTMITINMLSDKHPELKAKFAPLIDELAKGLELSLSEADNSD